MGLVDSNGNTVPFGTLVVSDNNGFLLSRLIDGDGEIDPITLEPRHTYHFKLIDANDQILWMISDVIVEARTVTGREFGWFR